MCTSCFRSTLDQPGGFLVRLMWALYSVVAPLSIAVTVIYWVLDYVPNRPVITVEVVMAFGGVTALILFDGIFICTIPVRLLQLMFPQLVVGAFVASTIIRDSLQEGGNYENEENKSSPYEWMFIWSENTTWSAAFAILLVFGVVPLAYLLVWMASLASFPCCCRLDGSRRVMYIPEDYDKRLVRKGLL